MLYKTEEKGISFLSTPGVGMQSATHSLWKTGPFCR